MALLSHRAAFLGAVLAFIPIAPADARSPSEVRQFRSSDVQPRDSPAVQAVVHMSALLRQRTGGRYGIDVEHNDKDSENFTTAQVRTGALDMARVNLAVLNSMVPSTVVPSLPFLFRSVEHMRRVLDGPIGEKILFDMEAEGLIGLCFYDMGARSFYSTKRPIRSVDDMKGLAVRVQPSDVAVEVIKAMGAKPVPMPFDRVAAALNAGVIDASENSWAAYVGAGHDRVARYFNLTEHSMMPGVLIFSKRVWVELSPSDRVAIRAAAKESVSSMRGKLDAYEITARLRAENTGSQVVDTVDRKSFARNLVPLYPTLAPDPSLQRMIRQVQADTDVASVP
jgi:tripartite ATP-independent transporter DctP family solute receptor